MLSDQQRTGLQEGGVLQAGVCEAEAKADKGGVPEAAVVKTDAVATPQDLDNADAVTAVNAWSATAVTTDVPKITISTKVTTTAVIASVDVVNVVVTVIHDVIITTAEVVVTNVVVTTIV